jgi:hypothetical protein
MCISYCSFSSQVSLLHTQYLTLVLYFTVLFFFYIFHFPRTSFSYILSICTNSIIISNLNGLLTYINKRIQYQILHMSIQSLKYLQIQILFYSFYARCKLVLSLSYRPFIENLNFLLLHILLSFILYMTEFSLFLPFLLAT